MVVSTMQVFEDSAKPDYCTRGTRFGNHSCNESLASVPSTFFASDFGKLTYIAYFDGGARAFDIRDPYHPKDVAHYVAAVHPLPYGEQPPNMVLRRWDEDRPDRVVVVAAYPVLLLADHAAVRLATQGLVAD